MAYVPFVPLSGLPTLITDPGQYVTRCGEIVTVSVVDHALVIGCDGHYSDGRLESWHRTGRLYFGCESNNDIVRRHEPATQEATYVLYGRRFGIAAEFADTEGGMHAANGFMAAHPDTGLLARADGRLIIAKLADKGVPL